MIAIQSMNSWRLFLSLIVFWKAFSNPIFIRETNRTPGWYSAATRLADTRFLNIGLAGFAGIVWITIALYFENLLIFLLFPQLLLMTITAIALAPTVAEERIKRTWESLLIVLPGPSEVLLGKVAGILWWIHPLMLLAGVLLAAVAVGVGFISLVLIPTRLPGIEMTPLYVLCLGVIVFPILGAVLFVVDRVQQYILTITAIVAVCAAPSVTRFSQFAAIATVMAVWLIESTFTGLVLLLVGGDTRAFGTDGILTIITIGPFTNYVINLTLLQTILCAAATFLIREAAIRGLWWWAVYRARRVI
jgi:hypothetical protein